MKYCYDEKTELALKKIHTAIIRRQEELQEVVKKQIESGAIQETSIDDRRAMKLINDDHIIKYLKERMVKVANRGISLSVEIS